MTLDWVSSEPLTIVNRPFNCGILSTAFVMPIGRVMSRSEVAGRLTMMSGLAPQRVGRSAG